LREKFKEAGVIFVVLPNLPGSKTNGATKKIGDNILLMVNNRRLFSDIFWFTLFHEIGHIMNGDYGITFEGEDCEDAADKYAEDKLIPSDAYQSFIQAGRFDVNSIRRFANLIDRDPGIPLGRLKNDKKVSYDNYRYVPQFDIHSKGYLLECCFHKRSKYEYQNEFRIAVLNTKDEPIGDLFVELEPDQLQFIELKKDHDFLCEINLDANEKGNECDVQFDITCYLDKNN
jgi:hypothetical protein